MTDGAIETVKIKPVVTPDTIVSTVGTFHTADTIGLIDNGARRYQQDRMILGGEKSNGKNFIVEQCLADGVGSEINSHKAAEEILKAGYESLRENGDPYLALAKAAKAQRGFTNGSATLILNKREGDELTNISIGDSYTYHITETGISQVNDDHSFINIVTEQLQGNRSEDRSRALDNQNLGEVRKILTDILSRTSDDLPILERIQNLRSKFPNSIAAEPILVNLKNIFSEFPSEMNLEEILGDKENATRITSALFENLESMISLSSDSIVPDDMNIDKLIAYLSGENGTRTTVSSLVDAVTTVNPRVILKNYRQGFKNIPFSANEVAAFEGWKRFADKELIKKIKVQSGDILLNTTDGLYLTPAQILDTIRNIGDDIPQDAKLDAISEALNKANKREIESRDVKYPDNMAFSVKII